MCGIAGVYELDSSASADRRLLQRMTDLLAHRGPDGAGHMVRGQVGFGHRRLSIIDLSSGGHQPMGNEAGTVWITYNGECYNYRELARELAGAGVALRSQSDTEVLLRLYERYGVSFLEKVDGMFALAIWDARNQTMLLARDRLGIKPLFYFKSPSRFLFASEMKALLADPSVAVDMDYAALSDYFHLLSIPDPHSILRGVRKLLPGHYLTVGREGTSLHQYWDVRAARNESMSLEEASQQFDRRFGDAVRSHMVADVPVGAFLSGGVDSSSIVAFAGRSSPEPIETFSITFPALQEFDESPFAAQVAAHCATRHREFPLTPDLVSALPRIAWHADEPFAISSAFALFFLSELARRHVKVVLSGDGADEVFGGYVWRHGDFRKLSGLYSSRALARVARLLRSAPIRPLLPARLDARLGAFRSRDERYLRSMTCYTSEALEELLLPSCRDAVLGAWDENVTQAYLDAAPHGEALAAKLYTDVKSTLVSEMLTKVDRMTMAHGLEARVPFLDHHLVDWAFTVPGRHKVSGGEGKVLVKKAMERYLPREILYRPKHGFNVPLKPWLRGELREFIRDHLSEDRIARRGLLAPSKVSALLDDHFSGRQEASNRIFALLMLELWFEQFVDRRRSFVAP